MAKVKESTFKLKCVGCKKVEVRPVSECHEQPFCLCGMPMYLVSVTARAARPQAEEGKGGGKG